MRPIDGDYISDALEAELCREGDDLEDRQWAYGYAAGVSFAVRKLAEAPTLTPPNETPPCYQPDGDGCAYQCYDGDDEPIEKCKECPLCYSDKQRYLTPPNEPLTIEQLREMDGEPVWIVEQPDWGHWELSADAEDYLADRDQDFYGLKHDDPAGRYGLHVLGWLAYRRPPEGAEDSNV